VIQTEKIINAWLSKKSPRSVGINEISEFDITVATSIGNVRNENQDRAIVVRFTPAENSNGSFLFAAVCDGLGGMTDGGKCAEIALSSIIPHLISNKVGLLSRSSSAIKHANSKIFEKYHGNGGTTLTAIFIDSSGASLGANVGDSRLYTISKSDVFKQISVDDNIAEQIKEIKGESASIDNSYLRGSQLTQFIGIGEDLETRIIPVTDSSSDLSLLLTSDGIHTLDQKLMSEIVTNAPSSIETVKRLLHVSLWAGGKDNASAIYIPPVPLSKWKKDNPDNLDMLEIWDGYGKTEVLLPAVNESNISKKRSWSKGYKPKPKSKSKKKKKNKLSDTDTTKKSIKEIKNQLKLDDIVKDSD